jgi:uncharacterized protein YccT (UPF0319 family)
MLASVTRALAVLALLVGCKPAGSVAQVVDLSTSIDELRRDFDSHRGEMRFVTLLAPT